MSIGRSEVAFTSQYDGNPARFTMQAQAHLAQTERHSSHTDPPPVQLRSTPAEQTSVTCLTFQDLEAIRRDLTSRMAIWRSEPGDSIHSPTTTFPFASDLEWLQSTRSMLQTGSVDSGLQVSILREQILHMLDAEINVFQRRYRFWKLASEQKGAPPAEYSGTLMRCVFIRDKLIKGRLCSIID